MKTMILCAASMAYTFALYVASVAMRMMFVGCAGKDMKDISEIVQTHPL